MGENLAVAAQQMARKSHNAAFISLAGFLIVIAAIGYSAWEIHALERRKAVLQSEVSKGQAEKEKLMRETSDLTAMRSQLQKEILAKQEKLDRIALQLATGKVSAAEQTLARHVETDASSREAPPRAYIQLRSKDQHDLYEKLAGSLRQAGLRVPEPEVVPEKGPKATQVRYFRQEDKATAEKAAAIISQWPVGEVKVAYVRGYEDSKLVKPHQIEVWLAPQVR